MNPVNLKCSLEAGRVRCSDIYGIQVGASDIGYATLMRWQTSVLDLQLVTDVNLKGLDSCGRRSSQASHRLHLVGGGRGNKVSAHGKTSSVMKPPEMKICRAPPWTQMSDYGEARRRGEVSEVWRTGWDRAADLQQRDRSIGSTAGIPPSV